MSRVERAALAVTIALGVAYAVVHALALTRENVNWDELALVSRATYSVQEDVVATGGRPGLATLTLMPVVAGCVNAIDTIDGLRILWALFTAGMVAGLFLLVRALRPQAVAAWRGAALAVALYLLVPIMQRWSLQVRADQPSLGLALLGGAAFLASVRRPWLAALGGALAASGYLFSQKAVYALALVALLAAGDLFIRRARPTRADVVRVALAIGGAAVVLLAYRTVTATMLTLVESELATNTSVRDAYAELGYAVYRSWFPLLVPHAVLAVALLGAGAQAAVRRDGDTVRRVIVSAAVLLLGLAITVLHTSRFPYFWMTLGLFPAVAIGISLEPVLALLPARGRWPALALVVAALLVRAVPAVPELLEDTQTQQRETLDFIARTFPPEVRGFHPEKALACRPDPDPMPTFFYPVLKAMFGGPDGRANVGRFIGEFRARPIGFMVKSFRFSHFPGPIRTFWQRAYVPYRESAMVPGVFVRGPAGTRLPFEAVVPGRFKLWQLASGERAAVRVDGRAVADGEEIDLAAGPHEVEIAVPVRAAILAWSLEEPPGPETQPFFRAEAVAEIGGGRRW